MHRDDRALRAAINVQYQHHAVEWYSLYQQKLPGDADAGAPSVPAE